MERRKNEAPEAKRIRGLNLRGVGEVIEVELEFAEAGTVDAGGSRSCGAILDSTEIEWAIHE